MYVLITPIIFRNIVANILSRRPATSDLVGSCIRKIDIEVRSPDHDAPKRPLRTGAVVLLACHFRRAHGGHHDAPTRCCRSGVDLRVLHAAGHRPESAARETPGDHAHGLIRAAGRRDPWWRSVCCRPGGCPVYPRPVDPDRTAAGVAAVDHGRVVLRRDRRARGRLAPGRRLAHEDEDSSVVAALEAQTPSRDHPRRQFGSRTVCCTSWVPGRLSRRSRPEPESSDRLQHSLWDSSVAVSPPPPADTMDSVGRNTAARRD